MNHNNVRRFIRYAMIGAMLLALTACNSSSGGVADGGGATPGQQALPPEPVTMLDPAVIPKFVTSLIIPPAMPATAPAPAGVDQYYEIAVRQFSQRILPAADIAGNPLGETKVWGYGSVNHPGSFHYPAFTIEAQADTPLRVKWINDLKDADGNYLPHLFDVDQTLHWANPPGGEAGRDARGDDPVPYTGPVPISPHLHGAHVGPESDGYPEAWFLPAAGNIPPGYAIKGTRFDQFDRTNTTPGTAVFQYPNDQAAATLWYHDHSLGLTRLNVYAGPVGFYLLRGGATDAPEGVLPRPAPAQGDPPGLAYYEIPIAIQDKSFNTDGSLFYPDNRAFFEGLEAEVMTLFPFIPDVDSLSDVSPIWNPEFFGNTMVVNGNTWPTLTVEPRRYRLRFLNGSDSRFLYLKLFSGGDPANLDPVVPAAPFRPFWLIGSDGGFLPAPVSVDQILMGPAERADAIVDFTGLSEGTIIYLINEGPDEPFGGGSPGVDFPIADRTTTGQVMQIVVGPLINVDTSTDPAILALPALAPLGDAVRTRQVSLNENESETIFVPVAINEEEEEEFVLNSEGRLAPCDPDNPATWPEGATDCVPFGPTSAMLGTVMVDIDTGMPMGMPMMWMDLITENPMAGDTEIWEIYNFTMDAHPIHLHQVQFEVLDREVWDPLMGNPEDAVLQPWEAGPKDTVLVYPGQLTRIKAMFDLEGLYVWHCHILSHEDNEMMRPFHVGVCPEGVACEP